MPLTDGAMRIDEIVIQLSRESDRTPEERQAAAQGFVPLLVIAGGGPSAFLLRARPQDLGAALDAASDREAVEAEERLAYRRSQFDGMASAVEHDFAPEDSMRDFVGGALLLFAEGLTKGGLDRIEEIGPCAVRFQRDRLDDPDLEAPPPDEAEA